MTVEKGDCGQLSVMHPDDYKAMQLSEAKAKLKARMALAERERAQGVTAYAFASLDRIEAKYGL